MFCKVEQSSCYTCLHGQEACRSRFLIGLAWACPGGRRQVAIDLGMVPQALGEVGAADEDQLALADRFDGRRSRQVVQHRKFADDRPRPEHGQDALLAAPRGDTDLEDAALYPVAAVARFVLMKERATCSEHDGLRAIDESRRKLPRQVGEDGAAVEEARPS